jgi:hypothetical protein
MTFSSSYYFTVNVPYDLFLPEYRLQPDVSLHPKTIPNSWHVAYCLTIYHNPISGSFLIIHWRRIQQPFKMASTCRNPVDLNQVSVEVKQLVHMYISLDQETFDSDKCRQRE